MTKRLNKKEVLALYLENVDNFDYAADLGDMRRYSCVIGILGAKLTFHTTGLTMTTSSVIDYLMTKTRLSENTLQHLVSLNDAIPTNKEAAKARITAYLRGKTFKQALKAQPEIASNES